MLCKNAGQPRWEDVRFFLAVARHRTLSAAATELGVNASTVGRRIEALERALDARLFVKRFDGYRPTPVGERLLARAVAAERLFRRLADDVAAERPDTVGTVVVTTVETLSASFVIPAVAPLRAVHSRLSIDLVTSARVLSLSRREADISVRLARPREGDLVTRKIGELSFGLFASPSYLEANGRPGSLEDFGAHDLIDWVDSFPDLAPAAWWRTRTRTQPVALRATSGTERLAAVAAGLGIGMLPHTLAHDAIGLEPVLPALALPSLEIWIAAHRDALQIARVRAVFDRLVEASASAFASR